jgi:predicted PurR-regulated permease PerM
MPRLLACLLVYLIILGVLALLLIYIIPSLTEQIKTLGNKIPSMVDDLQAAVNKIARKLGFSNSDTFTSIKKSVFNSLESIDSKSVINAIIGGATSVVSVLTTLVLSLMIGFYFLLDYHKLAKKMKELVPKKFKKDTKELVKRVNQSLRGYIQGVLIVMFFVFLSQTIGLSLAGHDSPMLFALICAVTDIIPFFGPWIGAIPAVIVGFLISPLTGVFTIISIVVVQSLENYIYQPIIMGKAMKLHPITIIASLLVFGHFFGILGMIFATPIVALIKLLFQFVDEKLKFMEKMKKA